LNSDEVVANAVSESDCAVPSADVPSAQAAEGAQAAQAAEGAQAAQAAEGAQAEKRVVATEPKAQKPVKKTAKAVKISYEGVEYLAIPLIGKGGSILAYDLYGISDVKRLKKLGSMHADVEGRPAYPIEIS
jgi:hypothetical protein